MDDTRFENVVKLWTAEPALCRTNGLMAVEAAEPALGRTNGLRAVEAAEPALCRTKGMAGKSGDRTSVL